MRVIFSLFVIVLAALYKRSVWNFTEQNQKTKIDLLAAVDCAQPKTELEDLPLTVQRWVADCGLADRGAIKSVQLKQIGFMRLKPDQQKWMETEAEQLISTDPPSFVWTVKVKKNPLLTVIGRDSFKGGKAQMLMKLAAFVPLAQVEDNAKMNESALQRYLMEMAWHPTAALFPYVTWKEVDATTAEATMTYQGVTGSATFYMDKHGELEKVVASRFKDTDEKAQRYPCIAEIKCHVNVHGITVPSEIEITWLLEDGPFTWYKFKVHDVQFSF
ncbi:DUF6920 family protein [Planococcus shixiaomingii]|uniref:DUF6920 family protein n=1 Tax=Planococcus shixiaomingii TaxID=3058393 RepID=UPI00262C0E0C|nr:DUF6544 family protein [Planococcus sp. N022]WKA55390.1 hypothetical protein QWY21_03140 [Planococcus sp. N022]